MENIELGECFCGDAATWYRTATAPSAAARDSSDGEGTVMDVSDPDAPGRKPRKSIGAIGLDDVDGGVCDGCMKGFTGNLDKAPAGWARLDMLGRQKMVGEESQLRRFEDDFAQVGADGSADDDW